MNERAIEPSPDAGAPRTRDAYLDALARPVAADGLSLALYAREPADAVGVAHALALRLREVHGLEVEFFVPADGDGLVARLAQIVAGVPPAVLHGQAPSPAPDRVLVAADATAIPIQAEQTLAALVRDCPGANTRVLLPVAGRPDGRDRRTSYGPRLVRVALDAEPTDAAASGAAPTDGQAEVAPPTAGTPNAGGAPAASSSAPSAEVAAGRGDTSVMPPVAAWLTAPVPARPARRLWMIGVGVLAGVLAVALGLAWFDPPRRVGTPPAAGTSADGAQAEGAQAVTRPDRPNAAAPGPDVAGGEASAGESTQGDSPKSGAPASVPAERDAPKQDTPKPDPAAMPRANGSPAEGAPTSAAPSSAAPSSAAPSSAAPSSGEAPAGKAPAPVASTSDAAPAAAPAPDVPAMARPASGDAKAPADRPDAPKPAANRPDAAKPAADRPDPAARAPGRRPDAALVRRTRDRAWFVQHAAVASVDEARDWLAARPELDRAGPVPILAADGRAMVAIVTGPFADRDSAGRWAETATRPDERWLRGARSLKAALQAP